MSELTIKLENLQLTLTDPVGKEDIRAAWSMVDEIIGEVRQLEAENEQLRFRECPVCGRRIVVLHEIASHMTDGEPCPGSCSLVRGE